MTRPHLPDLSEALTDPFQRFDELLTRKAQYTLDLIERAETLEGAEKARALRTIAAMEREIEILNDLHVVIQHMQGYYEGQMAWLWRALILEGERLKDLNKMYLDTYDSYQMMCDCCFKSA